MKIKSEQTSGIVTDSEPYNLMSQTANNGYSENSNQVVGTYQHGPVEKAMTLSTDVMLSFDRP